MAKHAYLLIIETVKPALAKVLSKKGPIYKQQKGQKIVTTQMVLSTNQKKFNEAVVVYDLINDKMLKCSKDDKKQATETVEKYKFLYSLQIQMFIRDNVQQ